MNEVREIVTRAVVAKGKKTMHINHFIKNNVHPYSILGCWIINHEFEAEMNGDMVDLTGQFEINIWYSSLENTRTEVLREKVNYKKDIKVKQIVKEYMENSDDVLAKILQHPTVNNARIVDDEIEVDISFEILAEVIGETKMQITVFTQNEVNDDDITDIDMEINEEFLKDK